MEFVDLATIIGSTVGIGAFFWKIIDKRFDKIDVKFEKIDEKFERVWEEFKDLREGVHEIKERVSVLEAETIMYNIIPDENKRSEAAKRMWDKRRAKRLASARKGDK